MRERSVSEFRILRVDCGCNSECVVVELDQTRTLTKVSCYTDLARVQS